MHHRHVRHGGLLEDQLTNIQTVQFTINGSDTNPWHRMGLKQNPFPQIGLAEYDAGCRALNKLGGDPIPPEEAEAYIRKTLQGFAPDFVDRAVASYRAGAIVHVEFQVDIDQPRYTGD